MQKSLNIFSFTKFTYTSIAHRNGILYIHNHNINNFSKIEIISFECTDERERAKKKFVYIFCCCSFWFAFSRAHLLFTIVSIPYIEWELRLCIMYILYAECGTFFSICQNTDSNPFNCRLTGEKCIRWNSNSSLYAIVGPQSFYWNALEKFPLTYPPFSIRLNIWQRTLFKRADTHFVFEPNKRRFVMCIWAFLPSELCVEEESRVNSIRVHLDIT